MFERFLRLQLEKMLFELVWRVGVCVIVCVVVYVGI